MFGPWAVGRHRRHPVGKPGSCARNWHEAWSASHRSSHAHGHADLRTLERRRDLAKLVKQEAEQARVAVRNIRRDALQDFKELLKEKEISEDEERRGQQLIQELTDQHTHKIDKLSEEKQQEIMSF